MNDEKSFRVEIEGSARRAGAFACYMSSMNKAGILDMYFMIQGAEAWVELKFAGILTGGPDTGALGHEFTKLQRNWMRDIIAQRGTSFGLVAYVVDKKTKISLIEYSKISDKGQVTNSQLLAAERQCHWDKTQSGIWLCEQIQALKRV